MTFRILHGIAIACLAIMAGFSTANVKAAGPGQESIEAAAGNNQFSFVLFYRANDANTQQMYKTLQTTLQSRNDAVAVPVNVTDAANQDIVTKFDATRIPLPAVVAIAPNGAVCSAFPRKIAAEQIEASFVSPGQAACLKALQDDQIVLLCAYSANGSTVPPAIKAFSENQMYRDRTQVVSVRADDPAESRFLKQLKVPTDRQTASIAFMAPPGSMLGVFDQSVSFDTLAETIAAVGKCCEDENCKFNKAAAKQGNTRR
ncbi:hypothetical protein [Roseiconus lacunae]|uniref:Thioredoxin domain-containing protein n=1 Tax=Roseiconus lacunae TaxID=2605694 RepID=A0ABT7PF10_9BACT|nr:hypothetical protein [Roseiconus lacunae]MDM4015088.1 hypothetical protein [Roseiconus lacunae]